MTDLNLQEEIRRWLFDPMIGKLVGALVIVFGVVVLTRGLRRLAGRYVGDLDTRYRVRKFTTFIGYILAFVLLAAIFSDRLRSLTVAFGVAGAGIAFALQEVIASLAGWIAISFGDFYKPGDRVQLGGIKGDVIDIGVLRTTLMEIGGWVDADLYNGRIVRVANSFVFKEPVINYSADFPFLWDEIKFPAKYGSDWNYTRDALQRVTEGIVGDYTARSKQAWTQVVRNYRLEDANIDPVITMKADQNWIEFTVRYIVDYRKRRATKDQIYRRILEEVDKSNNRIRIATTSFEMTVDSLPVLNVKSDSQGKTKA